MKKYDFHWRIVPGLPMQRLQRIESDGFKVEISGGTIVCKTQFTQEPEEELLSRARIVAQRILLAARFLRGQNAVLEFDYVKYEQERPTDGQILLRLNDQMPKLVDEVSVGIRYVKLGGTIVEKFLDDDSERITDLCSRMKQSAALKQMLEWKVEFEGDAERKLAPLYNIIELAKAEANGAVLPGVSATKLKKATAIMNNESIRTSRHPGKGQGALREIDEDELRCCREVVDRIIEAFLKGKP